MDDWLDCICAATSGKRLSGNGVVGNQQPTSSNNPEHNANLVTDESIASRYSSTIIALICALLKENPGETDCGESFSTPSSLKLDHASATTQQIGDGCVHLANLE